MSAETVHTFSFLWWSNTIDVLLKGVGSSLEGLTQDEAEKRRRTIGFNVLARQKRLGLLGRFISKLTNPLIFILLAAAIISAILGQTSDFIIIILITIISITIDVVQEHQAIEGAEKLRQRVSLTATVMRDGVKKEIPLTKIVPGDIICLSVGDMVPGDCRLLHTKELMVDQSALTGESFPQEKNADAVVSEITDINGRVNCVYMGTHVLTGEAIALVVVTGSATEIGHVATGLVSRREKTEFEKGMNDFGYLLTKTAVVVSLVVLGAHFYLAHDIL